MNASSVRFNEEGTTHVLRYQSLLDFERALTFPCNAQGLVRMDDLGHKEFNNYLFARALVGFEFAAPRVISRNN